MFRVKRKMKPNNISLNSSKNISTGDLPKEFLDEVTGDLMTDPVVIKTNGKLKTVDRKNYDNDDIISEDKVLKGKIEVWKQKNNQNAVEVKKVDRKSKYDETIKILIVGDNQVGKSALINRINKNEFNSSYKSTNVSGCIQIEKQLLNGKNVAVQLWESTGNGNTGNYYMRGADAVIFVADMNVAKSFKHIEDWIEMATINIGSENYRKILVLNKAELDCKVVSTQKAFELAQKNGMSLYVSDMKVATCKKYQSSVNEKSTTVDSIIEDTIEMVLEDNYRKNQDQKKEELINKLNVKLRSLKSENTKVRRFFTALNHCNKSNKIAAITLLLAELKKPNFSIKPMRPIVEILLDGETGNLIKDYQSLYQALTTLQEEKFNKIDTMSVFKIKY